MHHETIIIANSSGFNYNGNDVWLFANVDWIYRTVMCLRWLNRQYVFIGSCLFEYTIAWYTMHFGIANSPATQIYYICIDDTRLCADVAGISCWLRPRRKYVDISVCVILNVSPLGKRHTVHYNTITVAYSPNVQLLLQCHMTRRADVDVDWMYGTVTCWLWMNRKYVGIGARLNFNVSLLGIHTCIHTCLLFNYNCNGVQTPLRWCWRNIWNGIVLALDEQEVCW